MTVDLITYEAGEGLTVSKDGDQEVSQILLSGQDTIVSVDPELSIVTTEAGGTELVTNGNTDQVTCEQFSSVIQTVGAQGPPGPPAGVGNDYELLPFIGSGTGTTKTTTEINGNIMYERFSVGDELYVHWVFPPGFDRSKDILFAGVFFPTQSNGGGLTSSWEIHVTTHNHTTQLDETHIEYATNLPVSDVAYTYSQGSILLSHVKYKFEDTDDIHIRLKRVASDNDPQYVGTAALYLEYTTDGKVGLQGEQGPPGTPEDEVMYSKRTDFFPDITDPSELPSAWAPSTVYTAGDTVKVTGSDDFFLHCVVGGTSDTLLPLTFTETGEIVTDNTVTWIAISYVEDLIYKGEADPGTLESAASWRIRRIVIGEDDDITETWADGTANFNNVWDNRALLGYI